MIPLLVLADDGPWMAPLYLHTSLISQVPEPPTMETGLSSSSFLPLCSQPDLAFPQVGLREAKGHELCCLFGDNRWLSQAQPEGLMHGETPAKKLWVGIATAKSGFGPCNLTALQRLDWRANESKPRKQTKTLRHMSITLSLLFRAVGASPTKGLGKHGLGPKIYCQRVTRTAAKAGIREPEVEFQQVIGSATKACLLSLQETGQASTMPSVTYSVIQDDPGHFSSHISISSASSSKTVYPSQGSGQVMYVQFHMYPLKTLQSLMGIRGPLPLDALLHAVSDRGKIIATFEPIFSPIAACSLLDGGKNRMRCVSHFTVAQSC